MHSTHETSQVTSKCVYGSIDTVIKHDGRKKDIGKKMSERKNPIMIVTASLSLIVMACIIEGSYPFSKLHELNAPDILALTKDNVVLPQPFSTLDPVKDLNVFEYDRDGFSSPSDVFGVLSEGQAKTRHPLPTNKWYENILLLKGSDPSDDNRIYTVPYVISPAAPIPGIKLSASKVLGLDTVVQVTYVDQHSLTIGATRNLFQSTNYGMQKRYSLYDDDFEASSKMNSPLSPLGLTLKWKPENGTESSPLTKMSSSLVRGMPYGTMHYHYNSSIGFFSNSTLPTVQAQIKLLSPPLVDSKYELNCTKGKGNTTEVGDELTVLESVELTFHQSDYTWLVFYSAPVRVRCFEDSENARGDLEAFYLQVTGLPEGLSQTNPQDESILTSRITLLNNCTHGTNPEHCTRGKPQNQTKLEKLLKRKAHIYPGMNTKIDHTFFSEEKENGGEYSYLQFEWDPQMMGSGKDQAIDRDILMYSLP